MEWITKLILFARWGKLTTRATETINGITAEYEVRSVRTGVVVGYWAYGDFDPSYPYRGQPVFWR